jgi:hypothetical protein
VASDISQGGGTKQRIHYGMHYNVSVAPAFKPSVKGNFHTAEDESTTDS